MTPQSLKNCLCGNCKIENPCSCHCHETDFKFGYHEKIWSNPIPVKVRMNDEEKELALRLQSGEIITDHS